MTFRKLEDNFRKMGLSESEIRMSLGNMGMLNEENEADSEDDLDGEDFETSFLTNEEDEEDLDEAFSRQRTHKSTAKERRLSRMNYMSNKSAIKRKRKLKAHSAAGKRHAKLLAKLPKLGAHMRRVFTDKDVPNEGKLSESILEELSYLAESIDRDPVSRFDEYAEAFNNIADLGELLALRAVTEDNDEEAGELVIGLSVRAEDVLREMEEMGGLSKKAPVLSAFFVCGMMASSSETCSG